MAGGGARALTVDPPSPTVGPLPCPSVFSHAPTHFSHLPDPGAPSTHAPATPSGPSTPKTPGRLPSRRARGVVRSPATFPYASSSVRPAGPPLTSTSAGAPRGRCVRDAAARGARGSRRTD